MERRQLDPGYGMSVIPLVLVRYLFTVPGSWCVILIVIPRPIVEPGVICGTFYCTFFVVTNDKVLTVP